MGSKQYQDRSRVRDDMFAVRMNVEERGMLDRLAERLQRTRGDVLRLLVREAMRELSSDREAPNE